MTAVFDIRNLSVSFTQGSERVDAVKGVSFTVANGASFGIVGESGSGKSTVLRAICGLAPVTGGEVIFEGKPVSEPRDAAFYRAVQMVFQDPYA
ncbi:MAG: ATP-binding cassette domain-containing protein, partial [Pseudooceanicola sp.]|nr:ATP-binding cassette domain-containing protein [Pseudooceanicola sp.]